jgi:hypothetical protein
MIFETWNYSTWRGIYYGKGWLGGDWVVSGILDEASELLGYSVKAFMKTCYD